MRVALYSERRHSMVHPTSPYDRPDVGGSRLGDRVLHVQLYHRIFHAAHRVHDNHRQVPGNT